MINDVILIDHNLNKSELKAYMKFGKIAHFDQVDFKLPNDDMANQEMFKHFPIKVDTLQFFIGCTGWSMKEWVGSVYPKGTKSKDFLKAYGTKFNTIELNTTHYRIPTIDLINRWKEETPSDFKFCPKVPQIISHSRNLGVNTSGLIQFCDHIQRLEEKLGCCFMQLPPYFGVDKLPILTTFLEHFPSHIPLAIEFRHESWFSNLEKQQAVFDLLSSKRISTVITDVAGRRDVLHMRLTTPTAMIRFVGNGLHPTDYERADDWINRITTWKDQGLINVYFFPHQPDNIQAPEMAEYIVKQLQEIEGIQIRGPKITREKPTNNENDQQMSLF